MESCHRSSMPLHNQKVRKSNDDQSSSNSCMLARKEHNQTSWKEFIARNINGVLKSEIELLYPRWPLSAAVQYVLDIPNFLAGAT